MEYSPFFLRMRMLALSLISLISFLWTIMLSVIVFVRWPILDRAQRSFVVILLLTDILTMIMMCILLLLPFRPWLDGARFFFLLMVHIGAAGMFTYWNTRFSCPNQSIDDEGVCRLLIFYILMASWVIPILLVCYTTGLAILVTRLSKTGQETEQAAPNDAETGLKAGLQISAPVLMTRASLPQALTPISISFPPRGTGVFQPPTPLSMDFFSPPTTTRRDRGSGMSESSASDSSRASFVKEKSRASLSSRLSKPVPFQVY